MNTFPLIVHGSDLPVMIEVTDQDDEEDQEINLIKLEREKEDISDEQKVLNAFRRASLYE